MATKQNKRAQVSIRNRGEFTALSTMVKRNRDQAERAAGRLRQFASAMNEIEKSLADERDWLNSVDEDISTLARRTGLRV